MALGKLGSYELTIVGYRPGFFSILMNGTTSGQGVRGESATENTCQANQKRWLGLVGQQVNEALFIVSISDCGHMSRRGPGGIAQGSGCGYTGKRPAVELQALIRARAAAGPAGYMPASRRRSVAHFRTDISIRKR